MEATRKKRILTPSLYLTGAKRLAVWRRAQAVLGKRANDMLKEVRLIRREWK